MLFPRVGASTGGTTLYPALPPEADANEASSAGGPLT
jgi:hypothetical protein